MKATHADTHQNKPFPPLISPLSPPLSKSPFASNSSKRYKNNARSSANALTHWKTARGLASRTPAEPPIDVMVEEISERFISIIDQCITQARETFQAKVAATLEPLPPLIESITTGVAQLEEMAKFAPVAQPQKKKAKFQQEEPSPPHAYNDGN